jgi:hypothetical protein
LALPSRSAEKPLNDCTPDSPQGLMIQSELPGDGKPSYDGVRSFQKGVSGVRSRQIEEYKQQLALTPLQQEMLVGLLLGDACFETQNRGRTYRLKIEHSIAQAQYVQHLYEAFREWVLGKPQIKSQRIAGKTYQKVWFNTVSHSAFRFYAQQFYRNGKKVVPKLIHRLLTARGLAYWFMDDGSIKSRQSKGVLFNTQGFSEPDVARLIGVLQEKFGLQAKRRRQPEGQQIYISGRSYERFRALVEPYLIPQMRYKLPSERRPNLTELPKE